MLLGDRRMTDNYPGNRTLIYSGFLWEILLLMDTQFSFLLKFAFNDIHFQKMDIRGTKHCGLIDSKFVNLWHLFSEYQIKKKFFQQLERSLPLFTLKMIIRVEMYWFAVAYFNRILPVNISAHLYPQTLCCTTLHFLHFNFVLVQDKG